MVQYLLNKRVTVWFGESRHAVDPPGLEPDRALRKCPVGIFSLETDCREVESPERIEKPAKAGMLLTHLGSNRTGR